MNYTLDASDALAQVVIRRAWNAFVARRNARLGATLLRVLPPGVREAVAAEQREARIEYMLWMEAVVASYIAERDSYRRFRKQHIQCLRNRRVVVEVPHDAADPLGSPSLRSPQKTLQLAVDSSSLSSPSPASFPPYFVHIGDDASIRDHVAHLRNVDARHKERGGGLISPMILSPGQSLAASQTRLPENAHDLMLLRCSSTGTSVDAPSPSLYYAAGDDTSNHSTACSGQSTAIDGLLLGLDEEAFRSVSFLVSGDGGPANTASGSGTGGGPGTTSRRGSIPRTSPGDWWTMKAAAAAPKDQPNVEAAHRLQWTASAAAYVNARRQLLLALPTADPSSGEHSGGVSPQQRPSRGIMDRTSSTSSASDIVTLLATCPTLGSYEQQGGADPVQLQGSVAERVITSVSQNAGVRVAVTAPEEEVKPGESSSAMPETPPPPPSLASTVNCVAVENEAELPFSIDPPVDHQLTSPDEPPLDGNQQAPAGPIAGHDARPTLRNPMEGFAKRHVHIKAFSPYGALMDAAPRRGSVLHLPPSASPHRNGRRTPSPPASPQRPGSPAVGGAVMSLRERIDQQRRMLRADTSLTDIVDRQVAMRGSLRQHRQPRQEETTGDDGAHAVRPGSAMSNSAIMTNPSTSPSRLVTRSFTPAADRMKSDAPGLRVPPLLRARCHAQPTVVYPSSNATSHSNAHQAVATQDPRHATPKNHQDRKLRIAHPTPSVAWKRKQDTPLSKERTAIVPSNVVADRIRLASQRPESPHHAAHAALPYAVRCMASAVQPVNFRHIPSQSVGGMSVEDLEFLKKFHASVYYN